ncbi:MAG: response regulator [Pseudomonadales bacterium]|nr:response regulator [Pseudomonadales bacterium]
MAGVAAEHTIEPIHHSCPAGLRSRNPQQTRATVELPQGDEEYFNLDSQQSSAGRHKEEKTTRPHTLQRGLLNAFGSILLLGSIVYGTFLILYSYYDWQQVTGAWATTLLRTLVQEPETPALLDQPGTLQHRLHLLQTGDSRTVICAYDTVALKAAARSTGTPPCPASPDARLDGYLKALETIRSGGEPVGWVTLHVKASGVWQAARRQFMPALGVLLLVTLCVWIAISRLSRRAVHSLTALTRSVSGFNDTSPGIRVPPDAPAEVQELGRTFERLIRDLLEAKRRAVDEASYRFSAQNAAERAHRLLNDTINNIPQVVVAQRGDGSLLFANKAAAALYGYDPGELLDAGFPRTLRAPDGLLVIDASTDLSQPQEIDFRDPEGNTRHLIVSRTRPEGSDNLLTIAVDITEVHQLRAQLQFAQRLEMVGTLAGGIAHDFNNLLTPILGYASLLQNQNLPDDVQDKLGYIRSAADKARLVVQQILTFSRQQPATREPVDLAALIRDVVALMRATIPSGISIQASLEDAVQILADAGQIEQVMVNLITNASQSISSGSGTITIRLQRKVLPQPVRSMAASAFAELRIADTGEGMTADVLSHIFEPFFTTKPIGEGSGLGLSVVHGIISGHHGFIDAMSEPGQGSTFTVLLPLAEAEPSPVCKPGSILLVEDSPDVLAVVTDLLEALGHAVQGFSDPLAALKHFRDHPLAHPLLITDKRMPAMSGFDLARAITAITPGLPVVLLSGTAGTEPIPAFIAATVAKPPSMAALRDAVRKGLAQGLPTDV